MAVQEHKSSILDLKANTVSVIAYACGALFGVFGKINLAVIILPLLIYFLENQSTYTKKNSIQAFTLNLLPMVVWLIKALTIVSNVGVGKEYAIGFIGWITWMATIAVGVISIIAIVKVYKYEEYEIPYISPISTKVEVLLNKIADTLKRFGKK